MCWALALWHAELIALSTLHPFKWALSETGVGSGLRQQVVLRNPILIHLPRDYKVQRRHVVIVRLFSCQIKTRVHILASATLLNDCILSALLIFTIWKWTFYLCHLAALAFTPTSKGMHLSHGTHLWPKNAKMYITSASCWKLPTAQEGNVHSNLWWPLGGFHPNCPKNCKSTNGFV